MAILLVTADFFRKIRPRHVDLKHLRMKKNNGETGMRFKNSRKITKKSA